MTNSQLRYIIEEISEFVAKDSKLHFGREYHVGTLNLEEMIRKHCNVADPEAKSCRGWSNVASNPLAGDVFEMAGVMFRVMGTVEDRVIYKQYGFGVQMESIIEWKKNLESNKGPFILYRGGDADLPF